MLDIIGPECMIHCLLFGKHSIRQFFIDSLLLSDGSLCCIHDIWNRKYKSVYNYVACLNKLYLKADIPRYTDEPFPPKCFRREALCHYLNLWNFPLSIELFSLMLLQNIFFLQGEVLCGLSTIDIR